MTNPMLEILGNRQGSQQAATPPAQMPQANNPLQMIQKFNQFRQQMAGKNPKQMVEQLLQSGQMTQDQFQQLSQMANQLQNILK